MKFSSKSYNFLVINYSFLITKVRLMKHAEKLFVEFTINLDLLDCCNDVSSHQKHLVRNSSIKTLPTPCNLRESDIFYYHLPVDPVLGLVLRRSVGVYSGKIFPILRNIPVFMSNINYI